MNAPSPRLLPADDGAATGGAASAVTTRKLSAAIDTMTRGASFLQGRATIFERRGASPAARHAMVLANALSELDRFLNVLLNELAAGGGLRGPELRAFRRRRDAARKLAAYPALLGGGHDDHRLLRTMSTHKAALRRIFAARRPHRTSFAPVTEAAPATVLPAIDLVAIGAYYADLSLRLVGHAEGRPAADRDQAARPAPA